MKKKLLGIDHIYVIWSVLLILFLIFMIDQYCRMVFGGSFYYVCTGQNEITQEESEFLEERGTLIYGETLDSFPAQIYDPSLGSENGFAIDLMEQLSWEMGTEIEFQPLLWSEVFQKLDDGEVDILQVSYSEERAKDYYLSAPIYKSRGVVFLQDEGGEIEKLEELRGKRLAGIKEDYALAVLRSKFPELEILEYESIAECAEMLKAQKVDGIVADEQNIMYYAQSEKMFHDYYIVEEEIYEGDVVFAVRKSDSTLGEIIDKAVYKLRTKDVLEKAQQKWFLSSILPDALPQKYIQFWGGALLLGIAFFFVFLFSYIHGRTKMLVEMRTSELEHERRRMKTILDSIPQYLLEVTPEGTIQLLNQQAQKALSRKALPFCDSDAMAIREETVLEMLEDMSKQACIQKELELEQRWFRISCSSIFGKKNNENIILLAEDITLSRLQERRSIQNDKMLAIGQLASGVSHELKNPLEIICNYCYALRKGILHTKEDILDTIDVIEEEAKDANRIVESLLSFARTSAKEICETEVKSCIQMILQLQIPLLRKKGVEVQFQCPEEMTVLCNPEGIKKIVVNLLTNGADAMEDLPVKDQEKRIKIEVRAEGNYAEFEFQDNGIGMSEQEQERIFNPFYTTKNTGTGLGLYLVYQEIEKSNGSIEVYSRKGEGTLFRIRLPLKKG